MTSRVFPVPLLSRTVTKHIGKFNEQQLENWEGEDGIFKKARRGGDFCLHYLFPFVLLQHLLLYLRVTIKINGSATKKKLIKKMHT